MNSFKSFKNDEKKMKCDVLPSNLSTIQRTCILKHKIHFKDALKSIQDMFKINCDDLEHDTRIKYYLRLKNKYVNIYIIFLVIRVFMFGILAKFKKVLR